MTDFDLLKETIRTSGLKIEAVCERAGMQRATFYNRLQGKGEFTASEIYGLTNALSLSRELRDAIILSSCVN